MKMLILLRCAAAILVAAVVSSMRFATMRRIIGEKAEGTRNDYERAAFIARALTPMYSALHLSPKCLEKAIALHLALRWSRIASEVVLGANLHDGRFRAHAWVLSGREEFFRSPDCDYEPVAVVA